MISCLGLLGLISFNIEQRTKEIGMRKVLGAQEWQIVLLLFREFLILIGIANLIAWPVSYYLMEEWLQNFAHRIDISFWSFLISGAICVW